MDYIPDCKRLNMKWNIAEKPHDIECGNNLLAMIPKAQATKAKIDDQYYVKLRNF